MERRGGDLESQPAEDEHQSQPERGHWPALLCGQRRCHRIELSAAEDAVEDADTVEHHRRGDRAQNQHLQGRLC